MKKSYIYGLFILILALNLYAVKSVMAAQGADPEWPCIQRKVPVLTIAQIWTGKPLPDHAANWADDSRLAEFIRELAARRLPLNEADQLIEQFAGSVPVAQHEEAFGKLIMGLFDYMNNERSLIISGIARYANGQNKMAETLRKEAHDLDAARLASDANLAIIDHRQEKLLLMMRIFQERAQSLTYVCEVPTLVEQRLYALVRTASKYMP